MITYLSSHLYFCKTHNWHWKHIFITLLSSLESLFNSVPLHCTVICLSIPVLSSEALQIYKGNNWSSIDSRTTTRCVSGNDIRQSVCWTELAYIEGGVCLCWLSQVLVRVLLTRYWLSSEPGIGIFCKCYCIYYSEWYEKKDAFMSQNRSGLVSQLPRLPILLPWAHYEFC